MGPTRGHCGTTAGLSPEPTLGSRRPGRASGPWISGPGRGSASPDSLRQFWRAEDQIFREHSPKMGHPDSTPGSDTATLGRLAGPARPLLTARASGFRVQLLGLSRLRRGPYTAHASAADKICARARSLYSKW